MNYTQLLLLGALVLAPLSATAQAEKTVLADFETAEGYTAIGAYDMWEHSPFREGGQLFGKGNVKVVDNPFKEVSSILGKASSTSAKVLGAQRSRFGSNTYGAMVTLTKPFALTKETKYVHVKLHTPVAGRVMLVGLGRRADRPTQSDKVEQFSSLSTTEIVANRWCEAIFPISGAEGVDINNLLLVPEAESTHNSDSDFLFYVDRMVLSDAATPSDEGNYYALNYDVAQTVDVSNRSLRSLTVNVDGQDVQQLAVNQDATGLLYANLMEQSIVARQGQTILVKASWNGNWMHRYVYFDKDLDGSFDVTTDGDDMGDLVAYTNVGGKSSNGAAFTNNWQADVPAFTLPADLKPGAYRMRYKIDWDDTDAGGNASANNAITKNSGAIVDLRVIVPEETQKMTRGTRDNGGGLNGDVLKEDGSALTETPITLGQPITVKLQPESGFVTDYLLVRHGVQIAGDSLNAYGTPNYVEDVVRGYTLKGNTYTLPASKVDGDVEFVPFFKKDLGNADNTDDYALNFDPSLTISRTDRWLTSLTFKATNAPECKLEVPAEEKTKVYQNLMPQMLQVVPGDEVTTTVAYNTNGPMHGYLYIDFNEDGRFTADIDASGKPAVGSELVAYTYLDAKNSLGADAVLGTAGVTIPSFTIPADLPAGVYRGRYKIDWNNADPAGRWAEGGTNLINENGGYVVDFLVNVHGKDVNLEIVTTNGSIVGSGNTGLLDVVPASQSISMLPLPATSDFAAETMTIRHGYNLDGPQYVKGNRQWVEEDVPADALYTLAAEKVDGDVRVTADFLPLPDAEYELVFSDEFNTTGREMPNSSNWVRQPRYGATWNRFCSQTEEQHELTGWVENGNFVALTVPNPDKTTDNVDMLSGAIMSHGKFGFLYGKIESRIKTDPYVGNFPAFWMMPDDQSKGWPNDGEIDIWEQIDATNTAHHTVHSNWTWNLGNKTGSTFNETVLMDRYHTYGMEWDSTSIKWFVDGKQVGQYLKSTDESVLTQGQWPFYKSFYIILNQSVGNGSWAKSPDVNHTYQTKFDWVRVYQKKPKTPTSINNSATAPTVNVNVRHGAITISSEQPQPVQLVDARGVQVYAAVLSGSKTIHVPSGVYLLGGKKVLVP